MNCYNSLNHYKLLINMPGLVINITLDKYNKVLHKPVNNRPGYDINYISAYIRNYCYRTNLETEKLYDYFSIIRLCETPQQWAIRVRGAVQALIAERKWSVYAFMQDLLC